MFVLINKKFYRRIKGLSRIININQFFYKKVGIFTWRVSDWWRHLMIQQGTNATNYFMYQWAGPVRHPPSKIPFSCKICQIVILI